MLTKLEELLSGRKTYIVAVLLALRGIVLLITGDTTLEGLWAEPTTIEILQELQVVAGISLITLRAGISKGN